jgi:heme/copper-type cytochrome/quinol oxidase subunit 1
VLCGCSRGTSDTSTVLVMRLVVTIVGAVVLVAAGGVVVWIDYSHDRFVDGHSVQHIALIIWFLGSVCLLVNDGRRWLRRRRARDA